MIECMLLKVVFVILAIAGAVLIPVFIYIDKPIKFERRIKELEIITGLDRDYKLTITPVTKNEPV